MEKNLENTIENKVTIGIINPWPGDKSAEAEVLTRMKRAAEENGIGYIMLDNFGHVLNDDQTATDEFVDSKKLSFVFTTHYETPKILDVFHYHTVWNPPEIPLNLEYYTERVTNQYIMNDDFLIYDTGGMSNHLRSMLINSPRTLEGASSLTASFPLSAMLQPKLENPTLFYCGMNWEKVVSGSNRHSGLFKLLDETGKVKFFGPDVVEAWGGIRPWQGYKCYQHPIPFDGFSILKEINNCGICLVLSSDIHRRAGAATNRTYEACAAGAVIISDDNEFMLKYFKDAALFITYNKNNPQDTFQQIMEKYEWICTHQKEALNLAKRAQEIFQERFALDTQLQKIIENHPKRLKQVAQDLYATNMDRTVLVTFVLNTLDENCAKEMLDRVIDNIHNQQYRNIKLAVMADERIFTEIKQYCEDCWENCIVVSAALFDSKKVRQLTDGQAIRMLQKATEHDCYMNTTANEIWFSDHVTTLVRAIENTNALWAYSGAAHEDQYKYRRINFFNPLNVESLYYMQFPPRLLQTGQFLFVKQAHEYLPDFLFDCLDGMEHYAYANMLCYKYKKLPAFTKRMSFVFQEPGKDTRQKVMPTMYQIRFIQDLVRFDLPDGQCGKNPANKTEIANMINLMPIKKLIKMRMCRKKLQRQDKNSKKYLEISKKYDDMLKAYYEFWGN